MTHDFYCTNCASKVNTETVLFDMQELLTGGGGQKLQILKFRLTEKELRDLQKASGQTQSATFRCTLSLNQLMTYIGNENNLSLPNATELTVDLLKEFVEAMGSASAASHVNQDDDEDDLFGGFDDEPTDEPETPAAQPEQKAWPQVIEDLKRKDTITDSLEYSEGRLRNDLRMVRQLMLEGDSISFDLTLLTEDDDQGNHILTGMNVESKGGRRFNLDNRICPECGARIFEHAGTAAHKAVVFIGDQSSGKTSTILALTHYAMNHLRRDTGSEIWRGTATIPAVVEMKPLEQSVELKKELANYQKGIAPKKTDVRERDNAYSSTFLIRSDSGGKIVRQILTLTDLPGELCELGGDLKKDKILNEFAVAMACDTFVTCFDTSTVHQAASGEGGSNTTRDENGVEILRTPAMIIDDTCSWADKFQTMLIQNNKKRTYVPTMLLFTKCREIEQAAPDAGKAVSASRNLIQEAYMFNREQAQISSNHLYKGACDQFENTGGLKKAFQARLRCSPFGYPAPAANMLEMYPELKETVHAPEPKNIESLMRWVLMVSGCIPTEAEYRTSIGGRDFYRLNNFYIDRPQYRCENPKFNGDNPDEGLARCGLFANPGKHDRDLVSRYGNRAGMIMARVTMRPDTNDK